jgi:hypothetical protein
VTIRLAVWIQPRSPLAKALQGWRVRSNPVRVRAWARETPTYNGPATTPAASRTVVRGRGVEVRIGLVREVVVGMVGSCVLRPSG